MIPTPLSYYTKDLDLDELEAVDAFVLEHLWRVLPDDTALYVDTAGSLANPVTALLDPTDVDKAGLAVRLVHNSKPSPDATALVTGLTSKTLLLLGPVRQLSQSPVLRALALAADTTNVTVTPLHTLHPSAHGSQWVALTTIDGPAADALTTLAEALEQDYDFLDMAFENTRIQLALKIPPKRAKTGLQFPQLPQLPQLAQINKPAAQKPPPQPQMTETSQPPSSLRDRLRKFYHQVFTLETRLALRDLRWRIMGKKR